MENTAIYGGSFNPPTVAHAQVITSVLDKSHINRIIFTPDGERHDKDHKIDLENRKEMIQIFFEVLKSKGINIEIDNHFLNGHNGKDTTAMQVREYFKNKLGFYPWHIFGSDVAPQMPNWKGNKNRIIEEKLKKIFISRPGYKFEPEKVLLDNYMLLDIPNMLDISSSMARKIIKNKQKVSHLVFGEIEEYIKENGLYK